MNNMREEILLHYMERYPNRAYWEATIPADPKEIARIYAEVQREKEEAKRIGKRSLPPIGDLQVFETYYLYETAGFQ